MTATSSTPASAQPTGARIRAALRRAGRVVVDDLATENGWCWAYGVWYPYVAPWPRHAGPRRSTDA